MKAPGLHHSVPARPDDPDERLAITQNGGSRLKPHPCPTPRSYFFAAGFFAAGFFAAGFFAAGFFAAGFGAGFGAGFAGAAVATVVSTILAAAASFCTDATPLIAALLLSYAWLEATI